MTTTNIEWAQRVWNPVVGCTPVSPGCLNCYAAGEARRWGSLAKKGPRAGQPVRADYAPVDGVRIAEVKGGRPVFTGKVRTLEHRLDVPLKVRKPTRWFVNSMSDLFHEAVPFEFVDRVFAVMALCPQHTFLVLTKRPERMAEYFARPGICIKSLTDTLRLAPRGMMMDQTALNVADGQWRLPHVWLGASVEDQPRADERIPHLLKCPASVRFLSCEPLLGPVDLSTIVLGAERYEPLVGKRTNVFADDGPRNHPKLHWIICGGESGPHARPCNVAWVRSIVEQCKAAGVACFVKQVGAKPYEDADNGEAVRSWGDARVQVNGDHVQIHLRDKKGGTPEEWPADLRAREMPR